MRAFTRAAGWGSLACFRAFAQVTVADQVSRVRACEAALSQARDDVWSALAQIGADVRMCCDEDRS